MNIQNQLFEAALGITEPMYIESVTLDGNALRINVKFRRGAEFPCPVCGKLCKCYDSKREQWQHLHFWQYRTFVTFDTPRVQCSDCGIRKFVPPWTRANSDFTNLFEAMAVSLAAHLPLTELSRISGVTDNRLRRIIDFHVGKARGNKDLSEVTSIGIDETSSSKGQRYVTVIHDAKKREVIFACEGRDSSALEKFKSDFIKHGGRPDQITTVAMDLSAAFQKGVAESFPAAQTVFDKFHLIKLLNEAVDKVRREESKQNPLLKGSRYIWLKNPDNLTDKQLETLSSLEKANLQSAEAYRLKLTFQDICNSGQTRQSAAILIGKWVENAMNSGLQPLIKFANTVKKHIIGIMRYFETRITNGLAEGLNSLIGQVKRRARGYTNMHHFINMIYLAKGGLELPDFPLLPRLSR